ncbi:hypothetical protein SDC9_79211 [bioreactor metagenome]|uniref:Uncharacterized protein n=1 Tax=bioreactor metagenome TaxID=1076179 RepID=A0A644YVS0_9ZZZZ
MLITDGLHVPVKPLVEVPDKVAGVSPTQYGPTALNVGVVSETTETFILLATAHCPPSGVNVYELDPALAVLIAAGLQVPVMLLFDVVGRISAVEPSQYGPNASKEAVILVPTSISMVLTAAHWPASGVKV